MTDKEYEELLGGIAEPAAPPPQSTRRAPSETKSDEELGIAEPLDEGPQTAYRAHLAHPSATSPQQRAQKLERDAGVLAKDPLAAGIVAGVPAAGLGALAAPVVGPVIAGAGSGAAAAGSTGGDPWLGAALGAGASMLPSPAAPVAQAARGIEERAATAEAQIPYRAYGQAADKATRAAVKAIGPEDMVAVLKKYKLPVKPGVGGSGQAFNVAREEAGITMGANNTTMARDFGPIPLDRPIQALDRLQANLGKTTSGEKLAAAVAETRGKLLRKYGERGAIDPGQLNREISDIERLAYHGKGRDPGVVKVMQRKTARVLDDELQAYYDDVAKKPGGAERVENVRAANRDYRVLSRLGPITEAAEVEAEFAPTLGEKFATSPKAALADVAGRAVTAPIRGAQAIVRQGQRAFVKGAGLVREGAEMAGAMRPEAPAAASIADAVQRGDRQAAASFVLDELFPAGAGAMQ